MTHRPQPHPLPLLLAVLLGATSGPLASAQPNPASGAERGTVPPGDDEDEHGTPGNLTAWANDLDRPLARALAFERRDVIEDILVRPATLGAASPAELAREASIPIAHARIIVEGVRAAAAGDASPTRSLDALLRLGAPEGFAGSALTLRRASEAALVEAGMTQAEARAFVRYRASAQRANLYFRELKAIRDARARGAELAAERARAFRRASAGERVRMIARALGLSVAEGTPRSDGAVERARTRARILETATASAGGGFDPLAPYRRADGTIDWKRFGRSEVARGASGLAHFAFALFLKELAVVLHTGDRGRLEEFVDGLFTTDFFLNYGLFAAGARAADVAYGRMVRRITRKRFLSGILRTQLVLAAGLAVPMLARGEFALRTYLVDVAALGLSAAAVKAAVEGGRGLYALVRGGRSAFSLGRLATPVGWVATAGETAVVLLLGDWLAARLDRYVTERALNERIEEAERALNAALRGARGRVDERAIARALDALEDAYDAKRRYALRGVEGRLAAFRDDLGNAARETLRDDAEVAALERRLAENPSLARHFTERYGSLEAFLESMRERRRARVEAVLRAESEGLERDLAAATREAYVGDAPRPDPALPSPPPAPGSRLALYDEETTLLLRALDGTRDPEARRHIVLALERVRRARALDRAIYESSGGAPAADRTRGAARSEGLAGAVAPRR
ncbi:MAG: hypothetical protein D6731_17710 [Planctomycetota bacterium]|nr:MAG: hypothetical protein D6731_17710 [Planctomycetota bacterium]